MSAAVGSIPAALGDDLGGALARHRVPTDQWARVLVAAGIALAKSRGWSTLELQRLVDGALMDAAGVDQLPAWAGGDS